MFGEAHFSTEVDADLADLYQEVILEHNAHPRNFRHLAQASCRAQGHNPLCGDKLSVDVLLDPKGCLQQICFTGKGCAISQASASMMTDCVQGMSQEEAIACAERFRQALLQSEPLQPEAMEKLGHLVALLGVKAFPMRVKCATLAWHTLLAALQGQSQPISTENGGQP